MNEAPAQILVDIDPDLADLVPGYLANRRADVARVRLAITEADWAGIGRLAHGLKGSGGGYGFDPISVIGAGMEKAARVEDPVEVNRFVNMLEDYLARVRPVFG